MPYKSPTKLRTSRNVAVAVNNPGGFTEQLFPNGDDSPVAKDATSENIGTQGSPYNPPTPYTNVRGK